MILAILLMAILNFTGFETGDLAETGLSGGTLSVQSTTKNSGTYACKINPTTSALGWFRFTNHDATGAHVQPSNTNHYARSYFLFVTAPAANDEEIFAYWTGSNRKLVVRFNSAKKLVAYNSTTLISTGATVLTASTWYKLEIHLNASTNDWEIRLNGTTELSGNTAFSAGNITDIVYGKHDNRNSQTMEIYFDDIKHDDAGYPADSSIAMLKANGNGNYTAWTGTSTDVDELPPDGDTTKIATSTNTNAETELMEDSASQSISGTINAVKLLCVIAQTSTTTAIKTRLRSSTTDDDTTGFAPGTSYVGAGKVYATDPATSAAWTTGGIDGCEGGVVHAQAQSREGKCTAVYLVVDFTPDTVGMVYGSELFPQVTWI